MKLEKAKNIEMIKALKHEVEIVCQHPMQTPRDFDWLSDQLGQMGERLSSTTLKRCWGYLPEEVTSRPHTLDVLAHFLGYYNFDHFVTAHEIDKGPSSDPVLGKSLNVLVVQEGKVRGAAHLAVVGLKVLHVLFYVERLVLPAALCLVFGVLVQDGLADVLLGTTISEQSSPGWTTSSHLLLRYA